MTQKQQQLSFDKGITNVPSDVLCSDNALEESIGLVYDDGEHKVVQKPKSFMELGGNYKLLFVHDVDGYKNYIYYYNSGNYRYMHFVRNGSVYDFNTPHNGDVPVKIVAIGKTLVIETSLATYYSIWNGSNYDTTNHIPSLDVEFWLEENQEYVRVLQVGAGESIVQMDSDGNIIKDTDNIGVQEKYDNLVLGMYALTKKKCYETNRFLNPFFACAAIELYDGSFTRITNPVLLFPSVHQNNIYYMGWTTSEVVEWSNDANMVAHPKELKVQLSTTNLKKYSDIIKNVVIFVSDEIDIYDTAASDHPIISLTQGTSVFFDGIERNIYTKGKYTQSYDPWYGAITSRYKAAHVLKNKSANSLEEDIASTSNFYKFATIGLDGGEFNVSNMARSHTLETITSQTQLPIDYHTNSEVFSTNMYAYNGRLNLIAPKRTIFPGFSHFISYNASMASSGGGPTYHTYTIEVEIKTNSGTKYATQTFTTDEFPNIWFYYPDPRAKTAKVYEGNTLRATLPLKEHTGLNGAYYFKGIPDGSETYPSGNISGMPESTSNSETLHNTIATSEVNNPWVFKAEGYNNIGNGEILGVSTMTTALSQGQFGQYPLLVFCTDGIWAMSVNNTGLYSSIHPMSREVCNNPKSITQTDGAVFFSSEKGLMVVVGSQVKCVSEQMSGRNSNFYDGEVDMGSFRDYLKDCFIAYDYRDSLLWIFNNSRNTNKNYCYIYSIKSGTFSKYNLGYSVSNVVNSYPDTLIQSGSAIYTLLERKNINHSDEQTNKYTARMISRPMKLENGLALKSIMQVKHIRDMQGTMTLRIYASNNLRTWVELTSLRGIPWKYYRFRYDFQNLLATDRFAGSVVVTQERRTDKLR